MIAFHIDMNMAQFRGDYLEKWLRRLARVGYDTIVWEVENNVQWETCPECVAPEAFSKKEFKRILALCRKLGLEPVPLFQTLGHSEYALRHERYRSLRELPDRVGQYCARNPKVRAFLARWIEEYLDLFGRIRYFHLGADEARMLGRCEKCRTYAEKHSISQLYIDHINAVAQVVADRGVMPGIWADMLLTHPEALDKLSRKILLFDWRYDIYYGMNAVQVWGRGRFPSDRIPQDVLDVYGRYMFPFGDEPFRQADPFYTADYLVNAGFRVVGCPASSCWEDTVFTPTHWRHMVNTFSWSRKALSSHLDGVLVTSWTVRLVPWELQISAIDIPGFVMKNPDKTLDAYQRYFTKKQFGVADATDFWRAAGLLAKLCVFAEQRSLGFYKDCRPAPSDQVDRALDAIASEGRLSAERENCSKVLPGYQEALELLRAFARRAPKGGRLIGLWDLAARNLCNRARASALLLDCKSENITQLALTDPRRQEAASILAEMRALRSETERLYLTMQKPMRTGEIMAWVYDSVDNALRARLGQEG